MSSPAPEFIEVKCPVCGRELRVSGETCPAHTDLVGRRCQMSGKPIGVAA